MYNLIDFLCILSGAYLIYAAVMMKWKGKLISNVVLNKGMDENKIRDKEGLIRYLYGRLLFIGCIIVLAGIVNMANEIMAWSGIVTIIACCVFGISIVCYGAVVNNALKKYA